MYKMKIVDACPVVEGAREPGSKGKDFPKQLCDCCNDRHLCLHICFCTICRSAHTWHVTKILDYWIAVLVQLLCFPCMPCIGGLYLRGKLREHMGLEEDALMDFVKWCFCEPCSIGQEALLIDEESGVRVECCLKLQTGVAPLVTEGAPASSNQTNANATPEAAAASVSNEAAPEVSPAKPSEGAQEEIQ